MSDVVVSRVTRPTPPPRPPQITSEVRAEWREQAERYVNAFKPGPNGMATRILALLDDLDAAERERDTKARTADYFGNAYDVTLARAEAAEQRLAAVRDLADEWERTKRSLEAEGGSARDDAFVYDGVIRDLRAALGDADGGGDR